MCASRANLAPLPSSQPPLKVMLSFSLSLFISEIVLKVHNYKILARIVKAES
jgi:hypothetical protein